MARHAVIGDADQRRGDLGDWRGGGPRARERLAQPSRYLGRTRARDEEQLFTAWRLTSFVVGEYETLGAYEIQRLLARSEEFRPRAAELASTVVAGKSLRGPQTVWTILLSDAEAAREMLAAASAAGATRAEAPSPDPRMVSFSPPEGFEL